jgi:hypothetical protein
LTLIVYCVTVKFLKQIKYPSCRQHPQQRGQPQEDTAAKRKHTKHEQKTLCETVVYSAMNSEKILIYFTWLKNLIVT